MMLEVTKEDAEIIIIGLQARICFIETGTAIFRACDVAAEGVVYGGRKVVAKELNADQLQIIRRSEEIIAKLRRL